MTDNSKQHDDQQKSQQYEQFIPIQPTGDKTDSGPLAPPPELSGQSRSNVRYQIVLISIAAAFIMYLDRVCLSEIVKSDSFNADMQLSREEKGRFLGAFFLGYAFFQVPAGWLSDRFGARKMLTLYILAWSLMTGLTGLMTTLTGLFIMRFGCGIAQAGAYPTISATIRRWIRIDRRGQASSFVSFGGRTGGTVAPFVTVFFIAVLVGWRPTLWLYGLIGVAIAAAYWFIVRDQPHEHPRCNPEELQHIGHQPEKSAPRIGDIPPLIARFCLSGSLWLNAFAQFCINIGWVFLITWLPSYLKEVKGVPDGQGAVMVSVILAMGMIGQPIGGWATDQSVRTFGLRIGRVLPLSLACIIASLAYLICPLLDSVIAIVACLAVVSLMTDIGNPSNWAFMQDIGGKNTAAIFGWGNMWGNLGAAFSAVLLPFIYTNFGENTAWGYGPVFLACALAFFLAGVSALGMNATRPLASPE